MPSTAELAAFATDVTYDRLPTEIREAAKRRILDAVGIGIGSIGEGPTDAIRRTVTTQNVTGRSRLWGSDLSAAPPDAALYNGALVEVGNGAVFLAPTFGSAHGPAAAILAAAEARSVPGEAVLAGLAVAYEIHGELAWNAPIDDFHPATHSAIAAAAGAGRTMELDEEQLASAIGLAASRATLAVGDEEHAPLAVGTAALSAVYACLLAEGGVVGPESVESPDSWQDIVGPFDVDLDPGCERVTDAAFRPYDAHPYAQPAIEAAIDLSGDAALDPAEIDTVSVETFADAVPEIDSMALAAALVDRDVAVHPGDRADLEPVADAVELHAVAELDERAENGEVPARVIVTCVDGSVHEGARQWFTGHPATPESWGDVEEKFHALADSRYDPERRTKIVDTVRGLEAETAAELSRLLD
ncbi:MmgE/PrpD family protein [Natronomonas sp.]|uniref:MmgE/PrpD family protein n=1 Tax=Natronomonas sp. TaxID=2184060 RepID=UPI00398A092A